MNVVCRMNVSMSVGVAHLVVCWYRTDLDLVLSDPVPPGGRAKLLSPFVEAGPSDWDNQRTGHRLLRKRCGRFEWLLPSDFLTPLFLSADDE